MGKDTEEKQEVTGGTRGDLECMYVRAPLQLLSVLWGLGLLGQRVCFGEVHLQDVPL